MNILEENEKLKEALIKYQDHMDEGIAMMEQLSERISQLNNAIKKHKTTKEKSAGFISQNDIELWKNIE